MVQNLPCGFISGSLYTHVISLVPNTQYHHMSGHKYALSIQNYPTLQVHNTLPMLYQTTCMYI